MLHTPLYEAHLRAGAKIVEFAGHAMPVQYPLGLAKEHLHTRASAGLFDVSHMGQLTVRGADAQAFLNRLLPTNLATLPLNKARYSVLPTPEGGVLDDLIITRTGEQQFLLVLNAGRKAVDIAWLEQNIAGDVTLEHHTGRALLALQGPQAEAVLQALVHADLGAQPYMSTQSAQYQGVEIWISRLGYTGEDGFEISIPAALAEALWDALLADACVQPVGLGARDTLRMEMGYPLYGHDLDETTSLIEANLRWVMAKDHADFVGASRILAERETGPARLRVGVQLQERAVAREGCAVQLPDGTPIGTLTSGGMSPSLNLPMAQGYLLAAHATVGTDVQVMVRDRAIPARVTPLPFLPAKTKK